MDADGFPDVVVGAPGGGAAGRIHILYGRSTLPPQWWGSIPATAEGHVGWSVASLGDVNADGYPDVIAGSSGGLSDGSDGFAIVVFGGAARDTSVDLRLTGTATWAEYFGWSVAGGGDVNGDGHNDIIVGAPGSDMAPHGGRIYIYFGGPFVDTVADTILDAESSGDWFGRTVSYAGDVDDDGYGDFLVGAPYHDGPLGLNQGRVYLYRGGSFPNMTPYRVWDGLGVNNCFGEGAAPAGDVNDGGVPDIIVGAKGHAYVFSGEDGWDTSPELDLTGQPPTSTTFGLLAVAGAGDFNGDGVGDLVVGDYVDPLSKGTALVFYGGAAMDREPDKILNGDENGDYFGRSVAGIGDLNSDGTDEIIVGAVFAEGSAGRAHVFTNSVSGPDIPDATLGGEAPGDYFGYRLAGAGDFNCDGYPDVVVGAPAADVGGLLDAGKAYVYYGGPIFWTREHLTLEGTGAGDNFGWCVAGAGDVNNDGCSDVIVGAPYHGEGGLSSRGAVYLFLGGTYPASTPHRVLLGEAVGDHFGWSVAGVGDAGNDGYDDIIVGAPDVGAAQGRAYVYRGAGVLPPAWTPAASYDGITGTIFGIGVGGAGNINGDSYDDFVVGASGYVRVYPGGGLVGASPVVLNAPPGAIQFGLVVGGAGNLQLDGYDDVVVGAYGDGTNAGRAYVYRGGNPMDTAPWLTLVGETPGDYFGYAVGSAGDVNGDRKSDLIIGAPCADASSMENVGCAYVYFGRWTMHTDADIVMTGEAAGDGFGCSVAAVGDLNHDGLDDLLVGAFYNDKNGGTKLADAGSASLFLSSSPAVTPNISSVRDVPGDQGGRVTVSWKRSALDHPDFDVLVDYSIHRSPPPVGGVYAWEPLETVAGFRRPTYSYTASTLQDSTADTSGVYCFRVVARSYPPLQFWYSDTVAGYSVDNLPPAPPLML
ncbi:MAG: integrin alpha, partial [Bacteroidota bacterium]